MEPGCPKESEFCHQSYTEALSWRLSNFLLSALNFKCSTDGSYCGAGLARLLFIWSICPIHSSIQFASPVATLTCAIPFSQHFVDWVSCCACCHCRGIGERAILAP